MTAKEWKECQDEILATYDKKDPKSQREFVTLMLIKLSIVIEVINADSNETVELLERLEKCP